MISEYTLVPCDVLSLDVKSFDLLTKEEQRYLYFIDEVAWVGGLIDLIQLSPEAAGIFLLGQKIFSKQTVSELIDSAQSENITESNIIAFVAYFASIFGNLGNYLSFGDTKFIPGLSETSFTRIVKISAAYKSCDDVANLFENVIGAIYSLNPQRLRLAFAPDGLTTYYSGNCVREDAEIVQKYMNAKKIEAYNTRVFKGLKTDTNEPVEYTLAFASAFCSEELVSDPDLPKSILLKKKFGDYHELMALMVKGIEKIKLTALNENQKNMWEKYQESFQTGSIETHKEGSKLWVSDKQPAVESYIGFIESYRDPYGVRGEFEAFAAVVDKDVSSKFQKLVASSTAFISMLPWPKSYEKDAFLQPDFASLDIMAFSCSGLPVGINIPNYDDIRQSFGFKNVSLGNILKARFQDPTATFLRNEDKQVYIANVGQSFEIQVGLHELLGHGSGKLFKRNEDGTFNFPSSVRDIITNGDITHWYELGETWDSKFSSLASPFEECRAECVGVYLCDVADVLKIFDSHGKFNAGDVVYVNWLSMVRSGLMSLEFFSPSSSEGDTGAWRQAHCQARFAIFKVLLECDPPVLRIELVTGEDGHPDLCIHLDRSRIQQVAKPAVGRFLKKLQYYKSTGNVSQGSPFFLSYSTPTAEQLAWRQVVINRKKPRPFYVQPVLFEQPDGSITLKNYEGSNEGIINSFVDRYSAHRQCGPAALEGLKLIWARDQEHFSMVPL